MTIFAPANVAFELVRGALTSLPSRALNDILSYHVVPSNVGPTYSSNFTNATTLRTLQGQNLTMSFSSNSYFLNSARILTTDILIANGVIHIIDNVVSPNSTAALPNPETYTQAPILPTTGVINFNSSAAPFTTFVPGYVPSSTSETASFSTDSASVSGGDMLATASSSSTRSASSGAASPSESVTSSASRVHSKMGFDWVFGILTAGGLFVGAWMAC